MKRPLLFVLIILVPALGCQSGAAPYPGGESFTVRFPAVTVLPGVEHTQCVIVPLGNDHAVRVGTIENVLGVGSHHMIVYRTTDTTARPHPFNCTPFVDTLDPAKGSPLMITQRSDEILTLPEHVAFELDAHQMIRLEVHYINTTDAPIMVETSSTFHTIADADFRDAAAFLFIGTPDIVLQPHVATTVGPVFFELPAELGTPNFFAITGHTHQYGTDVRVSSATSSSDVGTRVYDVPNWTWSEPETVVQDPPFELPAGGGFQFECNYDNTSDQVVQFGESAQAEMCFFWAYYYPSHGPLVCFHLESTSAPRDVCCPGDPLCPILLGMR